MVLARAHIKHADPVVLLPVSKVHLTDFTGGADKVVGQRTGVVLNGTYCSWWCTALPPLE